MPPWCSGSTSAFQAERAGSSPVGGSRIAAHVHGRGGMKTTLTPRKRRGRYAGARSVKEQAFTMETPSRWSAATSPHHGPKLAAYTVKYPAARRRSRPAGYSIGEKPMPVLFGEVLISRPGDHPGNRFYTGLWPRGKARDFDSRIGGSNTPGSASVRFHAAKANGPTGDEQSLSQPFG